MQAVPSSDLLVVICLSRPPVPVSTTGVCPSISNPLILHCSTKASRIAVFSFCLLLHAGQVILNSCSLRANKYAHQPYTRIAKDTTAPRRNDFWLLKNAGQQPADHQLLDPVDVAKGCDSECAQRQQLGRREVVQGCCLSSLSVRKLNFFSFTCFIH
jgi:hypothetical protein